LPGQEQVSIINFGISLLLLLLVSIILCRNLKDGNSSCGVIKKSLMSRHQGFQYFTVFGFTYLTTGYGEEGLLFKMWKIACATSMLLTMIITVSVSRGVRFAMVTNNPADSSKGVPAS
jgi:hypothetical protein